MWISQSNVKHILCHNYFQTLTESKGFKDLGKLIRVELKADLLLVLEGTLHDCKGCVNH